MQLAACMLWEHEVASSSLVFPTMKEEVKKINHPHFYRHDECTFEELMNQSIGGISRHKDAPKMHLWLPSDATEDQVELVKKMLGGFFV